MTGLPTYGDILAANIRAARSRANLGQETVAARMRALGYGEWRYQTVGMIEKGKRRVQAEEVIALAWVFSTSALSLLMPTADDEKLLLPSGALIGAASVGSSLMGRNDRVIAWDGGELAQRLAATGHDPTLSGTPVR